MTKHIIQSVSFSIVLSALSLFAVMFVPSGAGLSESDRVYSPFHEDIVELRDKQFAEGLAPRELSRLRELVRKNEAWFEREFSPRADLDEFDWEAWSRLSRVVAPLVALGWAIATVVVTRRGFNPTHLLVLTGPALLGPAGLMPVIEVGLIVAAVLAVCVFRYSRSGVGTK